MTTPEGCRSYYAANKERLREKHARYKAKNPERIKRLNRATVLRPYGITLVDYDRMAAEQNHSCAICEREAWECRGGVLAVDHDHKTNKVRALLCTQCNAGIGSLQDDPAILEKAAEYLRRHK